MSKKILVVSTHPDDETLGCGGTLLKHKDMNDSIYCIHVTNGNTYQEKIMKKLDKLYGFNDVFNFKFNELDLDDLSLNKIIPKFTQVFNKVQPDILYIPNRSDVHSDHRRVFESLIITTKSFRFPFIKKIMMCEVISETDFAPPLIENVFLPNVFCDITRYYADKINIIKTFKEELLPLPYTRSISSIEAMNRYRGSQINVKYAETFMLIKEIL